MAVYTPDRWVVIDITSDTGTKIRKVLGAWYGGFAKGDSWRLNSGVTEVKEDGDWFIFVGYSGSEYRCHKNCEGTSMMSASILSNLMTQAESRPGWKVELVTPFTLEEHA